MIEFRQDRAVLFILALEMCCLAGCTVLAVRISSVAGPFKIVIQNLVDCPEAKQGLKNIVFAPRLTRDRTNPDQFMYNGNITFKKGIYDALNLAIDVSSWSSGGGWKANAHHFRFQHVCKTLQSLIPKQFGDFMRKLYGGQYTQCPYPAISSNVSDFHLDTTIKGIKQFVYGKFMADVQATTTDGVEGCVRAYADVVPKLEN